MSRRVQRYFAKTPLSNIADGKMIWIATALVVGAAFIALPSFRTSVNIVSILWQLAPVLLIATGQALVILLAGIDLSVGATAGIGTVMFALVVGHSGSSVLAIGAALLVGALVGFANGLGTVGGVNPLLMTFASAGVIQGVALSIQSAAPRAVSVDNMAVLTAAMGPIPVTLATAAVVVVGLWLFTAASSVGLKVLAVGWDTGMARRIGLPIRTLTLAVYAVCGVTAAAGGLAIQARTYTADALVGQSNIIGSIAVAMVAGVAITGGRGSLLNVIPAAIILTVADQAVVLTGIPSYWVTIMNGLILVLAVWIYGVSLDRLKTVFSGLRRNTTVAAGGAA